LETELVVKRYFPISFGSWLYETEKAASLFADQKLISCKCCGNDLASGQTMGIIVMWREYNSDKDADHIRDFYWCCKGGCDEFLTKKNIHYKSSKCIDGWDDIDDLKIPTYFIKWIMKILDGMREGDTYEDAAFEDLKGFILRIFPYVSRSLSTKQRERLRGLMGFPDLF
jgi:hypothetical protein